MNAPLHAANSVEEESVRADSKAQRGGITYSLYPVFSSPVTVLLNELEGLNHGGQI